MGYINSQKELSNNALTSKSDMFGVKMGVFFIKRKIIIRKSINAWFMNNAQVTATDVKVTATTAYSLMIKGSDSGDTYGTTKKLGDTQALTPVSTIGEIANITSGTDIANEPKFFASNAWNADSEVYTFTQVNSATKTGAVDTDPTYFYKDTVYLKSGQAAKLYLDSDNTGIWSAEGGTGTLTKFNEVSNANDLALLETMRVGFVVTQKTASGAASDSQNMYVYQLNATDAASAKRFNTTMKFSTTGDVDGLKYATSATDAVDAVTFKNLDGGSVKALTDAVMADGAATAMATTSATSDSLASLAANEEVQVDIYIWMEGCDYETTAANSADFAAAIQGIGFGFCIGATTD